MRMKFDDEGASVQKGDEVDRNQGAARAISVSTFTRQSSMIEWLLIRMASHLLIPRWAGRIYHGSKALRRVKFSEVLT